VSGKTPSEIAHGVASKAQADFFSQPEKSAVVVSAVAGAGKSRLVVDTVAKCRAKELRIAVCAPTNEQVFGLVRSIAKSDPRQSVAYIPAKSLELPDSVKLSNVEIIEQPYKANGYQIIVGTARKIADAHYPQDKRTKPLAQVDGLIIDESYQVDATQYFAVADMATRHLLVGDSGQIKPFSTVPEGFQWKGLPHDPLETAVGILRSNHPGTILHRFPITRRCDFRAIPVMRNFYPVSHAFEAAAGEGIRTMRLGEGGSVSRSMHSIDKALESAAAHGWALYELPGAQTRNADPEIAEAIVKMLLRLRARGASVRCEKFQETAPLQDHRVAVAVSHTDQKLMLRAMCDAAGLNGVMVNTANQLQGLEFDVTLCWHPLAGLIQADDFHLESGRLCVMCTRHRHACVVIGRKSDREMLRGIAPVLPAYPMAYIDDAPFGWDVHRGVFDALLPFIVEAKG